MHSLQSRCLVVVALLASLGMVGCGPKDEGFTVQALASATSRTRIVGPRGTAMIVPAGALGMDTMITMTAMPARRPPDGTASVAVPLRIGPEGQAFDHAVEIEFTVRASAIPAGHTADDVVVYRAAQGSTVWVPLPTRRTGTATVAAITEHLSDFIAVIGPPDGGLGTLWPCGDGTCSAETCTSCPIDCGLCLPVGECGNGPCDRSCGYFCTGAVSVADAASGFEWQRTVDPTTFTQVAAASYCSNLMLGAFPPGTFRLPTRLELVSFVDYARTNPAFDTSIFPALGGTTNQFWSATPADSVATGDGWMVDLNYGIVSHVPTSSALRARCVRTITPVTGGLVDNSDGTVTDTRTGLVWQQVVSPATYDPFQASTYCAGLTLGGQAVGTWRLPAEIELLGIVDEVYGNPTIDPMVFANTPATVFWSSTPDVEHAGNWWGVDFANGTTTWVQGFSALHAVRCVR